MILDVSSEAAVDFAFDGFAETQVVLWVVAKSLNLLRADWCSQSPLLISSQEHEMEAGIRNSQSKFRPSGSVYPSTDNPVVIHCGVR